MQRRIGFIGVILENREGVADVNRVLSEHADLILARMGLPRRERGISVITLVVEATTDELGSLSGRLGKIAGVSVKSALAKERK
jgi:putative iron-only hydrogenase system regulator